MKFENTIFIRVEATLSSSRLATVHRETRIIYNRSSRVSKLTAFVAAENAPDEPRSGEEGLWVGTEKKSLEKSKS